MMTPEALKNDQELGVPLVSLEDIFADHEFNCRANLIPAECVELAKDIANKGLQQPVSICPLNLFEGQGQVKRAEEADCKYILLSGYRRLYSYKINKANNIPALIKQSKVELFDAKDFNLTENLQRKDLNLYEEARGIRHYWTAGWTIQDTAERINKSAFWVQCRYKLLDFPSEVQEAAAKGYIKSSDIPELAKQKDPKELLKLAGMIRDKRVAGTKNVFKHIRKKDNLSTKKHRKRPDIFFMLEHIQDTLKGQSNTEVELRAFISAEGNGLATRALSWCAGEISTTEFLLSLRDLCESLDIPYDLRSYEERDDDF